MFDYTALYAVLAGTPAESWLETLPQQVSSALDKTRHGDLETWMEILRALPQTRPSQIVLDSDTIEIGRPEDCGPDVKAEIEKLLRKLMPWRKGPFRVHGIHIDTEWRSDLKWDRLKAHIQPLSGRRVLDVGCGNGYHCLRMAGAGALRATGIEPTLLSVIQFHAIKHFAGEVLVSENRYARMRNVWFLPSCPTLESWLKRSGYRDIRLIDVTATTAAEQRKTGWMTYDSLADFLDPEDPSRTVEGLPAPRRAIFLATAPPA